MGRRGWAGPCSLLNTGYAEELQGAAEEYGLGKLWARIESAMRELPVPCEDMRLLRYWA